MVTQGVRLCGARGGSIAAVDGAFVEFEDIMIDVMFQRFGDVGFAEIVVVFHGCDGTTARALDAGEKPESKTNVLRRQCFAMVPLAFDIRCVLNLVSLAQTVSSAREVSKKNAPSLDLCGDGDRYHIASS